MTAMPAPLIVVSVSMVDTWGHYWARVFSRAIIAAGGLPVLLGHLEREEDRRALLLRAGGLLLAGGLDIDPAHYGEKPSELLWELDPLRDAVELPLTREAVETGVPVVGTCRGMQVLNVALGGTLYLDASLHPGAEAHPSGGYEGFARMVAADLAGDAPPTDVTRHPVELAPGSVLHDAFGDRADVNSFHHQHVRRLGAGLRATAHAADGVIEGVEADPDATFAIGVQWELQEGWDTDPGQFAIFRRFVEAARERAAAGAAGAAGAAA